MSKKTNLKKNHKPRGFFIQPANNGVWLVPMSAEKAFQKLLRTGKPLAVFLRKHATFIPCDISAIQKPEQDKSTVEITEVTKDYIYGHKTCPKTGRIISVRERITPTNSSDELLDTAISLSYPLEITLALKVVPTETDPNTCNLSRALHQLLSKLTQ